MTEVETRCFRTLDDYASSKHHCFLAEFSPDRQGSGYLLCFRPTGVTPESKGRYSCKYTHISLEEMTTTGTGGQLSVALAGKLDSELSRVE
jgi:hypothetical protein